MAKIHAHGKAPGEKQPWNLIFRCQSCGCEFSLEYGRDTAPVYKDFDHPTMGDSWYEAACPEPFCMGTGRSTRKTV